MGIIKDNLKTEIWWGDFCRDLLLIVKNHWRLTLEEKSRINIFFRVLQNLLLELKPPAHAHCCLCLCVNHWTNGLVPCLVNGGLAAFAFLVCLFGPGARAEGKEQDCLGFRKKMLYLQKEMKKVIGIEEAKQNTEVWECRRSMQKTCDSCRSSFSIRSGIYDPSFSTASKEIWNKQVKLCTLRGTPSYSCHRLC